MHPRLLSLAVFSFRLQSLFGLLLTVMLGLAFAVAHAEDSAVGLLKQMIAIAADNGGVGRGEELNGLKQQIAALPKPAHGDTKKAQDANAKGLQALKAGQLEPAKQYFLTASQVDPANAEFLGNLGFIDLKTGDLKAAVKAFSAALALAPGRSASWANLAEVYALQDRQQEAVACYALTFHFTRSQDKTREFLQGQAASAPDLKIRQAAQQALQLSLISGEKEEETVADTSAEDSLDAPLPPTTPSSRSLPAPPVAPPPVAVAPPVATPVTPPAPPPVAPSVAASPIPPSLLPPAAATPALNTDAAANSGNNDIIDVVAQGMGTDQSSALNNAYSNAVQQALGLYVDAETMMQNDQIVRDQILTYSKGFIQKVDIVSQNQASGLFQVNIRAQVKRQKLLEQAKTNNISLKQVDGASLNGRVETQLKQEQDAKALLDKALSPFFNANLYCATLAGEPNVVKQDQENVTLSYPVYLYIDEEKYKKSADYLISILNGIAFGKKEYIKEGTHPIKVDDIREIIKLLNIVEPHTADKKQIVISIMHWRDPTFSTFKWLIYFLPGNFRNEKIENTFVVKLELLGENESDLISLGIIELNFNNLGHKVEWNGSPLFIDKDNGSFFQIYSFKTFFEGNGNNDIPGLDRMRNEAFIKLPLNINISMAKKDLAKVRSAKLQVQTGR
ncbi:MAG: hypothetical protein IPL99_08360 [Candidatus Competibacteraceae bacterium]|nr:hypothetical protein [Candidatus Competibacteraceae bacterium]